MILVFNSLYSDNGFQEIRNANMREENNICYNWKTMDNGIVVKLGSCRYIYYTSSLYYTNCIIKSETKEALTDKTLYNWTNKLTSKKKIITRNRKYYTLASMFA